MEQIVWKLTLAYDGTEFHGWQIQLDSFATPTIQGTLADAIRQVTGEQVLPQGSGRTDAGVHALAQVASFPLFARIPAENLQRALNRVLPAAIRILSAEPARPDFHARHSAIGKVYEYRIFHGSLCPPFLIRYVACSRWPLNLDAMQEAAQTILGEHDFTSFAATDPDRSARNEALNTPSLQDLAPNLNIRRIEQSEWSSASDPLFQMNSMLRLSAEHLKTPEILTYTVRGNGFLHHMVRNLVGTFIEVGRGRIAPHEIVEILKARDRALAGPTAPAQGLCLVKVFYPADAEVEKQVHF